MKTFHPSIVLTTLLVFFSLIIIAQQKQTYSTEEGKFSIKFPNEIKEEIEESETSKAVKVSCALNEQTFLASYTLHKIQMENHDEMEEFAIESFGNAIKGTTKFTAEWKLKNHSGLIAQYEMEEQGVRVDYRVLLVDQIQYQLIVLAANDNFDEELASKFFKSFKLKK